MHTALPPETIDQNLRRDFLKERGEQHHILRTLLLTKPNYKHGSVGIKWVLPFFPRIGEYISTTELLPDMEFKKLEAKHDYLQVINISWFLCKDGRRCSVEILL